MGNTAKGFRYPDGTDPALIPADMQNLAQDVDDVLDGLTYAEINALTGGDVWEGRSVYQTNTGTNRPYEGLYQHNGVEWRKPWNLPWGLLAKVQITSNVSGIGAEADVTGLSITYSFVANRNVEAKVVYGVTKATTGLWSLIVHDGTDSHTVGSNNTADGISVKGTGIYPFETAGGSQTIKVRAIGNATAGTVAVVASATTPAVLLLVDIGPSGAAA